MKEPQTTICSIALFLISTATYAQDQVYISQDGGVQIWQQTGIEVCMPGYGKMSDGWCRNDDLMDIGSPKYQTWKYRMDSCMDSHHRKEPRVDLAYFESGCEEVSHD